MKPITIAPITVRWQAWRDVHAGLDIPRHSATARDISAAVNAWARRADAWLRGLAPIQRADLGRLAVAEADLLWQDADQARQLADNGRLSATFGDWRLDWRERWHELAALAAALERAGEPTADLRASCRDAERAGLALGWLP